MEPEEQDVVNQFSTSNSFYEAGELQVNNADIYIEKTLGDITINHHRGPSPVDVNPLAEELKSKLTLRANEIIGETVLPIQLEREITRVKLQITEVLCKHIIYGDDVDWKEHMKRGNVSSVPTVDGSRIAIDQLFDKAIETATRAAPRSTTDEAKEKYIKRHGNTIGLIGLPGVGKTTTSKMVTKSILDKMILPETEYLFYISIKNVNFENKVTPLQFLTDNSLSNWHHYSEENKDLMNVLHNSSNVVIVIDGLDEGAENFSEMPKNCPLNIQSKPADIIQNLFNSHILPNAVKLVTSRPGQFYQIHPDCRPTFILEVLGMDQKAIDELGTQICGKRYPAIKQFLKERPNLLALCYVPVNCILIMACLLICLSKGKTVNSMTQVLIFALTNYRTSEHLKSSMREEEISLELVKLSKLAYKGFQKQKLVFDVNDFKEVDIEVEMANDFMHTYVNKASGIKMKILEGHKRSYFSHLMWQEFLTAVYMMLFMPYEQFKRNNNSIFKKIQWEVVARFMFGICNTTSKTDLEVIFPTSEIKDFEAKKNMIMDRISRQKIDPQKENFNILLGKVSGWMHELDDKEIIKQIEHCLPTNITLEVPSNPTRARDLAFAFKSCLAPHNLTVKADDQSATSEVPTFLDSLQGSPNTRVNLTVRQNGKLDDDAAQRLAGCVGKISELDLDWNDLSPKGQLMLQEEIQQLPSPQIKLTVRTDWMLGDHTAQCLAGCVGKISELDMDWNKLFQEGQRMLQEAIQQLPSPQIKLTVRIHEMLDDHAAQCLAGCVGKISELDLNWNKLSPKGHRRLQEAIKQLPSPQITLTVRIHGRFDDHTAQCLAGCVDKISELDLDWDKLSPKGQRILQEAIQQLPFPQIKLTVKRQGRLDDHAAQCLAGCVGKISELDLNWNKLSRKGQLMMKKAIKQLPSLQMKLTIGSFGTSGEWVLDNNAAQFLAECVGKLSEIDLDWNKLSPAGQLMLQEAIKHLPSAQIKLTVKRYSSLDDHAAQCLAGCVGKISELDLDWNKLSLKGQRMLQEAIQQLPSPRNFVLKGDENDNLKE